MATTSAMEVSSGGGGVSGTITPEDVAVKAVHKRYEGLLTVKTKAIKGKGAWYWAHLEPILLQGDSGLPKAVKLRCSLCDAFFSASNPSRTASEHLKRGTCPNFTSPTSVETQNNANEKQQHQQQQNMPKPINSISPHFPNTSSSRKRNSPSSSAYHQHVAPLAITDAPHFSDNIVYSSSSTPPQQQQQQQQQLIFSGGKEDISALALLQDSVKKLKSPIASPGPALSKPQADSALSLLSDWFYESSGSVSVSFSSLDHPKFRTFLCQVGLPPIPSRELVGARLDARYDDARADADARIRDAHFFQVAASGWKSNNDDSLVSLSVNLPNGTTVLHRALSAHTNFPSNYAEDILWETVTDAGGRSGGGAQQCAGIIADRFKSKALRSLESQNHWMVNLSCQLQGFRSLIKDFTRDLPLFRTVASNCAKVAGFFNGDPQARSIFHKHLVQEFDNACLLREAPPSAKHDMASLFAMLDDIVATARPLRLAVHDDSYKLVCVEDPTAREFRDMIRDTGFWTDLEAVHSLFVLVNDMVKEMEAERPLIGKCLPLWKELRWKLKEWCGKFGVDEGAVDELAERRFKKNYHPAWSAAFILDPLYLEKDTSGKYLPPFRNLTPEQEKDVDKLIMRLVSREEAHIVLMELMKWRSEGLDPFYAQAVQVKKLDAATGKMRIANPQSSRLVWETILSEEFRSLRKVAARLVFLHATSCGFRFKMSFLRHGMSRAGMDRAQKMIFVAAHAKLERRDFSNEEEKDVALFANGEEDAINEGFGDASSV